MANCQHCGLDVPEDSVAGEGFCCQGCQAAYEIVNGLGLESYYRRRCLDPDEQALKPENDNLSRDFSAYVKNEDDGVSVLNLMVGGLHCAACVWLIENVLTQMPGVTFARLNMTTRRLVVKWRRTETDAEQVTNRVAALGYRLAPFDPALLQVESARHERQLLISLAVSGFAAGNVMLLSISVWSGEGGDMGPMTRSFFHWLSALFALPVTAYAGRHFFTSALSVLRHGRTNMDVPISLALILTSGMSLFETMKGAEQVYFDSVLTLLFFLLIGRYLDQRARGRARNVAERLLALGASAVTILGDDGTKTLVPSQNVRPGMMVLAAAGDKIAVDGVIVSGTSEIDRSLISGETLPVPVGIGDKVEAGAHNLSAALQINVVAAGEDTLLASIVRTMEDAEQTKSRYVALADRIAKLYAPAVHSLALIAFTGWMLAGMPWQESLLIASAVLIITCPCALALAVPVVQVVASGRLFSSGILLKTGSALERLASANKVVFDKTGTLTLGRPELVDEGGFSPDDVNFRLAASMAVSSRHPLSQALVRAAPETPVAEGVVEIPGRGLSLQMPEGEVRLGRREWCGVEEASPVTGPELWLARPLKPPVRFSFRDTLREDAEQVVLALKTKDLDPELLSGDRGPAVESVAEKLGIDTWKAEALPVDKTDRLEELNGQGVRPLMVGDGLNDAPALVAAWVSMSPSSAADISQNAADIVFQGNRLNAVVETIDVAKRAESLVRQNIGLSLLYNSVTIPLAMAGYVTPLVAAIAMSTSSLAVIVNALRLTRRKHREYA